MTWYLIDKNDGRERELKERTDDYTLNLYRAKGFVLELNEDKESTMPCEAFLIPEPISIRYECPCCTRYM